MSHLAHIVKVKENLIAEGIVNPQAQIEICQTAYTKALITVSASHKLDEQTRVNFNRYILSYWNEVTPVNGNLVLAQIGAFFRELAKAMETTFVDDVLVIKVVPTIELPLDVKYSKLQTYADLVQILIDEANHKLQKFVETNQVI